MWKSKPSITKAVGTTNLKLASIIKICGIGLTICKDHSTRPTITGLKADFLSASGIKLALPEKPEGKCIRYRRKELKLIWEPTFSME